MDDQNLMRLKLLQRIYTELVKQEEELGWPGDNPHWALRQYIKKILDDNKMDDPEDDDMGCGVWDSHDKTCNIENPCEECCNIPAHKFVGNIDFDCEACGLSIYMPCHDVAP